MKFAAMWVLLLVFAPPTLATSVLQWPQFECFVAIGDVLLSPFIMAQRCVANSANSSTALASRLPQSARLALLAKLVLSGIPHLHPQ
eukprot:8823372-Prorocentrum_lima.AAC.1